MCSRGCTHPANKLPLREPDVTAAQHAALMSCPVAARRDWACSSNPGTAIAEDGMVMRWCGIAGASEARRRRPGRTRLWRCGWRSSTCQAARRMCFRPPLACAIAADGQLSRPSPSPARLRAKAGPALAAGVFSARMRKRKDVALSAAPCAVGVGKHPRASSPGLSKDGAKLLSRASRVKYNRACHFRAPPAAVPLHSFRSLSAILLSTVQHRARGGHFVTVRRATNRHVVELDPVPLSRLPGTYSVAFSSSRTSATRASLI